MESFDKGSDDFIKTENQIKQKNFIWNSIYTFLKIQTIYLEIN
jgi:hypothetical protein